MPTHLIKFGSQVLTDIVESLQVEADTRVNIQPIINRHGGLVTDTPVLDGARIVMGGRMMEDDATTLRDALVDLETNLGTTRQRLYTLFDDRYYNAYKEKFTYKYVPWSAMKVADFQIEFLADDPFQYKDPTPSTTSQTITAADTSVGGGRYRKSFSITYNGNANSYLTVVTAYTSTLVSQVIVRNLTTGKTFNYNAPFIEGMLQTGQNLTVDHGNFSVIHSVQGSKITNFSGNFVYLQEGINSFQIEGEPASYSISYEERYH